MNTRTLPRYWRGKLVTPLYVTKAGKVCWPIMGGAADDAPGPDDLNDPDDDSDADDDDSADDDDDSGDDDKDQKGKKKSTKDDDDDEPSVPQWKYDKMMVRMQNADKRSSALEKELAELKKSGMDKAGVDAELKKENDELKPRVAKLVEQNTQLQLQIAFLSSNDIQWVDPSAALKLVDLSDVEIDEETGKVDTRALKAALKQLAREKKYLVRPAAKKDEDDSDDSAASGPKMNSKRKGSKDGSADRKALVKRFPALNAG